MRETLETDLRAALNGALNMLGTVEQMLPVAADVLLREQADRLEEIRSLDREVDAQEAALEAECLRIIALHQPVARDLRLVALILKSLSDIERMGDYAVHVAEDGAELAQSPALKRYINLGRMLERLGEMSQNLRTALADRDVTRAEQSRGRILKAAARTFRAGGLGGSLHAVMRGAGLTHGGFYAHFPDKRALVRATLAVAVRETAATFTAARAP